MTDSFKTLALIYIYIYIYIQKCSEYLNRISTNRAMNSPLVCVISKMKPQGYQSCLNHSEGSESDLLTFQTSGNICNQSWLVHQCIFSLHWAECVNFFPPVQKSKGKVVSRGFEPHHNILLICLICCYIMFVCLASCELLNIFTNHILVWISSTLLPECSTYIVGVYWHSDSKRYKGLTVRYID